MVDLFLKWIRDNHNTLYEMGIIIDHMLTSEDVTNDGSIAIDYMSQTTLGRISVWESGCIDMEILDIDSEKTLLYKHYEFEMAPDFGTLLAEYWEIMQKGLKG